MVNDISPLGLIEIAMLGQYDTATANSEHMRVGTNALGLAKLTSSLASVQIIAIYHHTAEVRLKVLKHRLTYVVSHGCLNIAAGCSLPFLASYMSWGMDQASN